MSQALYDQTVDFEDRSGGLRVVVFDDGTARIQPTGIHSAKIEIRHSDLDEIDTLFTEARQASI